MQWLAWKWEVQDKMKMTKNKLETLKVQEQTIKDCMVQLEENLTTVQEDIEDCEDIEKPFFNKEDSSRIMSWRAAIKILTTVNETHGYVGHFEVVNGIVKLSLGLRKDKFIRTLEE